MNDTQRRALHGPFGPLWPAAGRRRLFGDEHRVRPVPDHAHPWASPACRPSPWPVLLGAVLPLLAGIVLGNLDHELRAFLKPAIPVMIPFFAFGLGNTARPAPRAGSRLMGVGLGVAVVALTGPALMLMDRLTGGNGVAGIAAAPAPGNSAARARPGRRRQSRPTPPPPGRPRCWWWPRSSSPASSRPLVTAWWAGRMGRAGRSPSPQRRRGVTGRRRP
ncbi:MAG: 2-keto-3-deoxygluconate permease [Caulobacteraceae bacterium]